MCRKKEDERKEWLGGPSEERSHEKNRPAPQNGYKGFSDVVVKELLLQSRYVMVFVTRNTDDRPKISGTNIHMEF
jgi:hypothetical protein